MFWTIALLREMLLVGVSVGSPGWPVDQSGVTLAVTCATMIHFKFLVRCEKQISLL